MVKYYCDDCGTELFMPNNAVSNMSIADYMRSICNCDGFKYYDSPSGSYLDLCNNCRIKRLLKETDTHRQKGEQNDHRNGCRKIQLNQGRH